ncbi:MAG TPA: ferritin family protein [Geobacterales bacterium]|nr:ferritin family protein [Geobacterales bacterium]
MNVIDYAVTMERDAKTFYDKLAANAAAPEFRTLFTLLADAEQEHLEALEAMKREGVVGKAEFRALHAVPTAYHEMLQRQELLDDLRDDRDGYRHVMHEEEESVRFYEELARTTDDQETRNLLERLAQEERKHLQMISNIYDFVESPRTYLEWGEFSNLNQL